MIRFVGSNQEGRIMVGLGITKANVEKLAQGKPIKVTAESVGLPHKIDFVIFYGETLEILQKELAPLIGPDTKVEMDPLLRTEAGERGLVLKPGHKRGD